MLSLSKWVGRYWLHWRHVVSRPKCRKFGRCQARITLSTHDHAIFLPGSLNGRGVDGSRWASRTSTPLACALRRARRVRLPCTPASTTKVLPKKSHGHSDRGEFSNRNHLAAGHQTIEAFCRLFLHPGKKVFIPIQGECPENSAAADDCRGMYWYRAEPEDTRSS